MICFYPTFLNSIFANCCCCYCLQWCRCCFCYCFDRCCTPLINDVIVCGIRIPYFSRIFAPKLLFVLCMVASSSHFTSYTHLHSLLFFNNQSSSSCTQFPFIVFKKNPQKQKQFFKHCTVDAGKTIRQFVKLNPNKSGLYDQLD